MSFKTGRFFLACGLVLGLGGLSACGVSKEALPPRSAESLPDFPIKERDVESPNTCVMKSQKKAQHDELLLTASNFSWNQNVVAMPTDADKCSHIQKVYTVPIQFDGWLSLTNVSHSFQHCNGNIPEPKFILLDDLKGQVDMVPDQKVKLVHYKRHFLKVIVDNTAGCTGVDVQFAVLYGE